MSDYADVCARLPAYAADFKIVDDFLPGLPYRSARSPHWVKMKDPAAPVVKREAEEAWADGLTMSHRKPGKPGYWTNRSKKLGRRELIFDEDETLILLKAAIEREGSSIAFAEHHSVNPSYISHVLTGRYPIAHALIKALGLRKVYVAVKKICR